MELPERGFRSMFLHEALFWRAQKLIRINIAQSSIGLLIFVSCCWALNVMANPALDAFGLTPAEQAWLAKHQVIRIGGESDWPPFDFVGDDGTHQGLTADYLQLLSQRLGVVFDVATDAPWSVTVDRLRNKTLDGIAAIAKNNEREQFALFTRPYTKFSSVIFTRKDYPLVAGLDDLLSKKVAIERDYYIHDVLQEAYPNIELLVVDDTLQALEAVSQGRADAYVGTLAVAAYLLEKHFISNIKVSGKTPFGGTGLTIGVRNDWPELVSILNKGLASITAAEHIELRQRWIAIDYQDDDVGRETVDLTVEEMAWLEAHPELRFTGDPNWLPFEAFDENGSYLGIVSEILTKLERKTGIKFHRLASGTWLNSLKMVKEGDVDVISGDLADEEIRRTHVFTQPYLERPLAIVMRSEQQEIIPDLYDIADKNIAVIDGYGYTWELAEKYPDITFIKVADVQAALSALSTRRVDAFVASFTLSSYHINQMGLSNLRLVGRLPVVMKLGFAVRKDWPVLLGILNKGIDKMTQAEKHQIIEHWMNDKYIERVDYRLVWQTVIGAAVLIVSIFLWSQFIRQQKKRLKISEERFQLAMEAASDGIWDWDVNTGEVYYSPSYVKMLGYLPRELAGRVETWETLLHPDDKAAALSIAAAAIRESAPRYEHEFRLRAKDGQYRDILSKGGVVKIDKHGKALRSVGTQTDITERKKAEVMLQKLSRAVEQNPCMVMITDPVGIIEYVNPKFTEITGYTFDEAVGKTPALFKSALTPPEIYQDLWQTICAGRTWHGQLQNTKKDGTVYWERESISPLVGEDGAVRHFVALKEDISKQKETEENLMVFRRFAETSGQGFGMATLDGYITYANQTLCRLLEEESPADVCHNRVEKYYPPEFQLRLQNEIIPAIKEKGQWTGELMLRSAKGKLTPVLENFFLIRDEAGKPIYFADVVTNISEQKQVEAALQCAKEQAEQASRFKSEFLANMSHEIRTPLNAVMGMTHLTMRTELTAKQRDYLSKVQSSSHTLLGVINDILDFSKIEAGKLKIENTDFLLESVFENLANLESMHAAEKGIEIIFSIGKEVPKALVGDPLRLAQVLINLTSNAVKFTERGQVLVAVALTEQSSDRLVLRFSVQDSGIGIDKAKISRLFEPFTQADGSTTREYGGTGLGLAICKQLVSMMGGEIGAHSEPGHGSTFFFTAEFGCPAVATEKHFLPSPDLRGTRVLVVDDNAIARQTLKETLESFSFHVSTVVSGAAALAELERAASDNQTNPYDLVLMDWKMPGMDGVEASRLIHHTGWLPRVPTIIMITAYGREEVMQAASQAGIDGFLVKPVNHSILFDTIIETLGKNTIATPTLTKHEVLLPPHLRGAKVLLVEDNRINQQVAQEMLENAGLDVSVAGNGAKAVQAVQTGQFDLVLMDIQMPDMDGYQATRLIRKAPRFNQLPIVAMTAHVMTGDREKCLDVGMNDHLAKPIDPEALYAILIQWIVPGAGTDTVSVKGDFKESDENFFPDNLPGIDIKQGLLRVGGNRKLFCKLLFEFIEDHSNDDEVLAQTINQKNQDEIHRVLHTLRGVTGSIGAEKLEEKSALLEHALMKQLPYVNALIAFAGEFRVVMDGLVMIQDRLASVVLPSVKNDMIADQLQDWAWLQELDVMLKEGNPAAVDYIEKVKKYGHIRELKGQLNLLDMQLAEYEFDDARKTLSEITQYCDNLHHRRKEFNKELKNG